MKEFLKVGQITNTHGVKGELKVYPLTDDIKRFRKLKTVLIDNEERKIVWCKPQTDKVIMKIEGVETMEQATALKSKYLFIKREDAVKLPENSYFVADLIGCSVYDENGVELGRLDDVIFTGSNDVYWVKGKEEILVPALKDIVVKVDIDEKKIIIKPLETWQ